jgi:hypothetical protein
MTPNDRQRIIDILRQLDGLRRMLKEMLDK